MSPIRREKKGLKVPFKLLVRIELPSFISPYINQSLAEDFAYLTLMYMASETE